MANQQWLKELMEFKHKLAMNLQHAFDAYITANEHDDGPEFWNDEFGMNAKETFEDFIEFLNEWKDGSVEINAIVE